MNQLIEGASVQVPNRPYIMRNIGGVYDCSCTAWKLQSRPIDMRTCKHLCEHLGVENERARVGNENMPTKYKLKNTSSGMATAPATLAINCTVSAPAVLLAEKWTPDIDPTGWLMSEKLDGIRAYWNGTDFLTRNGNILHAPDWFKAQLPSDILDGELWLARGEFQQTMSIVRRLQADERWQQIKYRVFDTPNVNGGFENRLRKLTELVQGLSNVEVVVHDICTGLIHLERELTLITNAGGEGLMLREPGSRYEGRRSRTLLKAKPWDDTEVRVVGHTAGKGKHKGRLGALIVELDNGKTFNVGGGFTDTDRENPPVVGEMITVRYCDKTKAGIPRHAFFVRPGTVI